MLSAVMIAGDDRHRGSTPSREVRITSKIVMIIEAFIML